MKVPREFFGMMYQGSSVRDSGEVQEPYFPVPIGVQRLWDTRAVMTFFGEGPFFNFNGFNSQLALAERTGSKVMYTFGFSGDKNYPPPEGVLLPGSKNRPRRDWMRAVVDGVLDISLVRGVNSRRIHYYELLNEPAIGDLYWDVDPLPARVADVYEYAAWLHPLIKARDAGAPILSPSLNDLLEPTGFDFALRYCRTMQERGPACDAIAFHMYAKDTRDIEAQLARLDLACQNLSLDRYCTEYKGPWEAFDIMAARGIKCLVWNGQIPPGPYEDRELADRWIATFNRLTTVGPNVPPVVPPTQSTKGKRGCLLFLLPGVV